MKRDEVALSEVEGQKLVFCEAHPSQRIAARREAQIKGWTRKKKIALIKGDLTLLKEL
jgi:predicted GIY-YIG superfamily endonuclease